MRVLRDRIRENFPARSATQLLWKAAAALITVIAPQNTKEDETTALYQLHGKQREHVLGSARMLVLASAARTFGILPKRTSALRRGTAKREKGREPKALGRQHAACPTCVRSPSARRFPVVCYRARSFSVNGRMEWMISPRNLPASGTQGK